MRSGKGLAYVSNNRLLTVVLPKHKSACDFFSGVKAPIVQSVEDAGRERKVKEFSANGITLRLVAWVLPDGEQP